MSENRVIFRLRNKGLVEMGTDGHWKATRLARELEEEFNALRKLLDADRPGTPQSSAPRRRARTGESAGTATPRKASAKRDDSAARGGATGKVTR